MKIPVAFAACVAVASAHAGEMPPVLAMHAQSANTGWLATAQALVTTRDAGAHWRDITPPDADAIGTVYFLDSDNGWVIDAALRVFITHDGGASWTNVSLPTLEPGANATSLRFTDARHGWLTLRLPSSANFSRSALLSTIDGGATWQYAGTAVPVAEPHVDRARFAAALAPGEDIAGSDFVDANHGWILVAGGICASDKSDCRQYNRLLVTDDGGHTTRDATPQLVSIAPREVMQSIGKKGFDQCAAGTVSQMQSWWTSTPWSWANIYIGGVNRGCSQPNLTANWVTSIYAQGWTLVPTWVGLQAPGSSCSGCAQMSATAATAAQQGLNEATAAHNASIALGLASPNIVYYDMEGYTTSNHAAVQAFIDGWVRGMHGYGDRAGVYGGGSNASSDWAVVANPPDAVWIANWNGSTSVYGLSGLSDTLWACNKRLHQYEGGHNETWNGVTFNIDSNSSRGPVAATNTGEVIFEDCFESLP